MTPLEHIGALTGLLLVGIVVFVFVVGTPTQRRRRRERKRLEVLLGGKR